MGFKLPGAGAPPLSAAADKGGDFQLSTFTFPNELESKPPPFEDHEGWGTRKSQTSPSALGYRSGTIQPREFLNRKTRKDGPPAEMCDQTKDVSDRIKELGDKATQLLTFLSFALAVGVLLQTSRTMRFPHRKRF